MQNASTVDVAQPNNLNLCVLSFTPLCWNAHVLFISSYDDLARKWSEQAASVGAAAVTITNTIDRKRRILPAPGSFNYIENEYVL